MTGTEPVYLREIRREDVPIINTWRQDREVTESLLGTFRYVNEETDHEWFDSYCATRHRNVRLAIIERESDRMIGVVYLLKIDWISRVAELGIFIGDKDEWGKGYGTRAVELALRHAFYDLNLHRVYTMVLADNEKSPKIFAKYGMVKEGVARQAVYKNGEYKDCHYMGLLRADFEKALSEL